MADKKKLKDFETRVVLRQLTIDDFDSLVKMQQLCFPGMQPWSREQIASQIKHFPEGQLCIEIDGEIAASSSSLVLSFDDYLDWHNWKELSASGYITNHDPDGDTLYGIEIMVHPEYRGYRLSRRLYAARKDLCRKMNLRRMTIGGRIPGYKDHAERLNAREYVDAVMNKELYDQVLTAQLANGFALRALTPNYFPSDTASLGYASLLEWINLDYHPDGPLTTRTERRVRISVVQYKMRSIKNFDEFASQVKFFVDTAADGKSDFVLFPELFTLQLLSCIEAPRPGLAARELAEFTPQLIELFADLAVKFNINIVSGSQFVMEQNRLLNKAFLFRRNGTYDEQCKLHVTPNERRWWGVEGGDKLRIFDTDRGKVAILICYDIEFPELARAAVLQGAKILFVPFNTSDQHGYSRVRLCARARAIENGVFVALSGCIGNLPFVENADIHYAQSGIFTPCDIMFAREGIAAECNPNIETILTQDLDLQALRRFAAKGTVTPLSDRRTDLYHLEFKNDQQALKF